MPRDRDITPLLTQAECLACLPMEEGERPKDSLWMSLLAAFAFILWGALHQLASWLAGAGSSCNHTRRDQPCLDLLFGGAHRFLRSKSPKITGPGRFRWTGELSCHLCARFRGTLCRRNTRILAHCAPRNGDRSLLLLRIRPESAKKAQSFLNKSASLLEWRRLACF